jgi:hypothetical protein
MTTQQKQQQRCKYQLTPASFSEGQSSSHLLNHNLSKTQGAASQQQHLACLCINLADPQGPTGVMTSSSSNNSNYNNNIHHQLAHQMGGAAAILRRDLLSEHRNTPGGYIFVGIDLFSVT